MDTISVKLTIDYRREVSITDVNRIMNYINNLRSPSGNTYCDFLEMNKEKEVIVKISYPRFYYGNNSYLVKNSELCMTVNRHFCDSIRLDNFYYEVTGVSLIRVDIPFTYIMRDTHCFWHYENIYKVFAMVYTSKNKKSNPKMISTILERRVETLNYSDTKVVGNYNSKIMVYDQYINLRDKLEDFQLNRTLECFPDLTQRIRLEVSKRVSRNPFTLDSFFSYDIYGEYYPKFKNYLLENFLDSDIIEKFYNEHAFQLAEALRIGRTNSSFKYEVFILNNIHKIFDYEIIRRALNIAIDNIKTREGAITSVRRILGEYQISNNIIVMETHKYLVDMRNKIEGDLC